MERWRWGLGNPVALFCHDVYRYIHRVDRHLLPLMYQPCQRLEIGITSR